ncbi:hypothetical protein G4B88_010156 [Cannabis sativa]|uniref:Uncharacterized protein n=1 Tax=Cannabis sativa TaxID=3483 RepID=A0A7J6E8Y3_CANSA|nr:hypothetical protein G4B88_010156 [Cannabis sativa]
MADIGAQTLYLYIFRERESVYDLFEAATDTTDIALTATSKQTIFPTSTQQLAPATTTKNAPMPPAETINPAAIITPAAVHATRQKQHLLFLKPQ